MSNTIITISRQFGSGGRKICHLLADRLGIPCYDRSIIDKSAEVSELSSEFIAKNEQQLSNPFLFDMTTTASIYKAQSTVIEECAKKGSCVIVGRCADKILENDFSCLKVFLYADFDKRCERAVSEYGNDAKNVRELVKKVDKGRERFFRLFHDAAWKDASNYNLCIDTGLFGIEHTIKIIQQAYQMMNKGEAV